MSGWVACSSTSVQPRASRFALFFVAVVDALAAVAELADGVHEGERPHAGEVGAGGVDGGRGVEVLDRLDPRRVASEHADGAEDGERADEARAHGFSGGKVLV
jgi:hypothetical protein